MVVCDPPEQSATDLKDTLELSAGSVSAAVRLLNDMGIVKRVARPGDRNNYYRLSADAWERALEERFRAFTELRTVAERAHAAAGGECDERLAAMRRVLELFEAETSALLLRSRECATTTARPPVAIWRET
jgi:DNA-binding transcriptional regulator GbsR (MarR family)